MVFPSVYPSLMIPLGLGLVQRVLVYIDSVNIMVTGLLQGHGERTADDAQTDYRDGHIFVWGLNGNHLHSLFCAACCFAIAATISSKGLSLRMTMSAAAL